jgi:DNA-binding LacI/PurR family transcriptional regulator
MEQQSSRPRQADIARTAGVSVSTVSRVLGNEPGISEPVRQLVFRVADELGYKVRPNAASGTLALIASDGATGALGAFYEGIIDGMRGAALQQGLALQIRLVRWDRASPEIVSQHMESAEAGGIFLVGIDPSDGLRNWLKDAGIPTVLVNGTDPPMEFDGVSPSNFFGAYRAVNRLIAAGHRRILHVTGSHRHTILERGRGFEAALAAVGGESRLVPMSFQRDATREAHEATLDALRDDPGFTAAFCMNDFIAVGVLEAVTEAGRKVPDDFAIVGFDDLPCAEMTMPRLATMRVDRAALGSEAVSLMSDRFRFPEAPIRHVCHAVVPIPGGTLPDNL